MARFCSIALRSASEMDYQFLLARDFKLLRSEDHQWPTSQTTEVKRMLTGLLLKLKLTAEVWVAALLRCETRSESFFSWEEITLRVTIKATAVGFTALDSPHSAFQAIDRTTLLLPLRY